MFFTSVFNLQTYDYPMQFLRGPTQYLVTHLLSLNLVSKVLTKQGSISLSAVFIFVTLNYLVLIFENNFECRKLYLKRATDWKSIKYNMKSKARL